MSSPQGSGVGQPRQGMSLAGGGSQACDVLAGASNMPLAGWAETAGILQAYNRRQDRMRSLENGCRSEHTHMDLERQRWLFMLLEMCKAVLLPCSPCSTVCILIVHATSSGLLAIW